MKADIHPTYYQATVTCVGCGTTFTTGSTVQNIRVDICSKCHPFFTGQKKLIDTEGRVEKFAKRVANKQVERTPQKAAIPTVMARKPQPASPSAAPQSSGAAKSLRDMLQDAANTR